MREIKKGCRFALTNKHKYIIKMAILNPTMQTTEELTLIVNTLEQLNETDLLKNVVNSSFGIFKALEHLVISDIITSSVRNSIITFMQRNPPKTKKVYPLGTSLWFDFKDLDSRQQYINDTIAKANIYINRINKYNHEKHN